MRRRVNPHKELCTKVAKALKDSGTAAAEYQQVVLELQGLQNVLVRLAALEPTESNAQHVNAIRAAALGSIFSLREFLSKLEKFEPAMSPFAAKKPFTMSKAGRQTQYAVFMAEEIQKIRALVYGNVIRINMLLATHASETLSRTEARLVNQDQQLTSSFENTKNEMAKIIKDFDEMRAEATIYRAEAQKDFARSFNQVQELSSKVDANTVAMTQNFSNLAGNIGSFANSISGIRNLSAQILSLLRVIPAELGSMIQNVVRSNARIESTLLSMDQKMAASPSMSLETNIRLEDALGRTHADIPFEWFQYWETFEGLLKARFKDVPGRQKIDNGEFRLVHANRPSVSLDKDSWSGSISPGAHIVMLMLISNIAFGDSSCPRRSCTGKVASKPLNIKMVTCPECGLRFIPQALPADIAEADEITRLQRIEDAKLFGEVPSIGGSSPQTSRQILDVTEDVEMMDVSGDLRLESSDAFEGILVAQSLPRAASPTHEPPIMSWLSQTVQPKDPESALELSNAADAEVKELKERDAKDLEIFRNVQITIPVEAEASRLIEEGGGGLDDGARIYYRNILDRYPQMAHYLARRLAMSNWQRQKRLTAKQSEAERTKLRDQSRNHAPEGSRKRKSRVTREGTEMALPEVDDWEDIVDETEWHRPQGATSRHPVDPETYSYQPPGQPYTPHTRQQTHHPQTAEIPLFDLEHEGKFIPPGGFLGSRDFLGSNLEPFPSAAKAKERKFCSLPPLPVPILGSGVRKTTMLCYLCHSQVQIQKKQEWR
jgi:hypothetical protein